MIFVKHKGRHVWRYFCLGMYRHCYKCRKIQGNHIEHGWIDLN